MTTKPLEEQNEQIDIDSLPTLEERIQAMLNRTPEQIAADRARILAGSPEPRPLPPGKTLEDVIVGALPDDDSEEEILAALEEIE